DSLRPGLLGGPGDVLARALELSVELDTGLVQAEESVQTRAADPAGELERDRDVLPELRAAVGDAGQPAISGGHVARVEVEQRDLEAGLLHRPRHGLHLIDARPHELDAGEAGVGGAPEALGERYFLEQKAEVGGKSHAWGPDRS